jgi:hypothetical protein
MSNHEIKEGKKSGLGAGLLSSFAIPAAIILMAVFVLASLAIPVIDKLHDVKSVFDRSFGSFSSDSIGSLAFLCIIIIGAVGLAKVLRKK